METQLARIANKGLAGEPENVVIQELNTLKVFNFSQIKFPTAYSVVVSQAVPVDIEHIVGCSAEFRIAVHLVDFPL